MGKQEPRYEDYERLQPLLEETAARHAHLCPRQVLGVRIGLCGLRWLDLVSPLGSPRFTNHDKRLLTIAETDGCGADGIAVATRCEVGRRTLRIEDYGKVAATLVDTHTLRTIRVWPRAEARHLAARFAPNAPSTWHAYLSAYQIMPDDLLLEARPVRLRQDVAEIISEPGLRATCARCQEEIMNERELIVDGIVLCRGCAGLAYYRLE